MMYSQPFSLDDAGETTGFLGDTSIAWSSSIIMGSIRCRGPFRIGCAFGS